MARRKPKTDRNLERNRDYSEERADRYEDDREISQDRVLNDDERLDMFRMGMFQAALPDLPEIDGYHVCWLTTTNPRDSIQSRARLGYEPIRPHELQGWEATTLKTGDYAGCIGINEMVAYKLPLHLYEAYMREAHHVQPLMEEQAIRDARQAAEEEASSVAKNPVSFELEEGMDDLGEAPEAPSFEDTLTDTGRHVPGGR